MLSTRNQWTAPIATILRLTNTVKLAKGVNATNAPTALVPSSKPLIPSTTGVRSALMIVEKILQSQAEGSSLRGISRINKRAYNTVVSIVHAAAYRAQLVHNEEVKEIETDQVIADEMWSFVKKTETLRT